MQLQHSWLMLLNGLGLDKQSSRMTETAVDILQAPAARLLMI